MSKTDPKSPKALQGSGVAFMGAGAAFMAIGATKKAENNETGGGEF